MALTVTNLRGLVTTLKDGDMLLGMARHMACWPRMVVVSWKQRHPHQFPGSVAVTKRRSW